MSMPEDIPHPELEERLASDFKRLVGKISLTKTAVPCMPDFAGNIHAEPIEDFALHAITGEYFGETDSLEEANYDYTIDDIPPAKHCLCLDASAGIALSFQGDVAGFSAAGISLSGALRIVQLQGSDDAHNTALAWRGRQGGILWADTLVEAWAQVANSLGIDRLELLAGENNRWLRPDETKRDNRIIQKYTAVALRRSFVRINGRPTENWTRSATPARHG